jgi:Zinc knuckle
VDINVMTTEKQITLMKKGACFICEKPGHLARDHKEYVENKKGKARETNFSLQKKPAESDLCGILSGKRDTRL